MPHGVGGSCRPMLSIHSSKPPAITIARRKKVDCICGSLFHGYATAALVPTAFDFTPRKWTFTFHGCWPGCWESWRWWWARFTSAGSLRSVAHHYDDSRSGNNGSSGGTDPVVTSTQVYVQIARQNGSMPGCESTRPSRNDK